MSFLLRVEQRWHRVPARTRTLALDAVAVLLWGGFPVIWSWHQGNHLRWSLAAAAMLMPRRYFPVCTLLAIAPIEWFSDADIFPTLGCAAYSVAVFGRPWCSLLSIATVGVVLSFAPWDRADPLGPAGEVAFQLLLPTTTGLYVRRNRHPLHSQR